MSSRRKLKKTMQFISSELITDVFFKTLLSKKELTAKADELVLEISKSTGEFIKRAGRYDGKENPKVVKEYFRKLYSDWNDNIQKLAEKIEKL